MKTVCSLAFLIFWGTTSAVAQEPLNALPGKYTGTLVSERTLTRLGSPWRTARTRHVARVTGIAYVPAGNTRTLIHLILPTRGILNQGLDNGLSINFEVNPPTVAVQSGEASTEILFPAVAVKGERVICVISSIDRNRDEEHSNVRTLRITRTEP
jgi:hypothetical protein